MKWFINLKTSVKLISSFVVMAIILCAVGVYGLTNLQTSNEKLNFMYKERVIPISKLGSAETAYQNIRVNIRDLVMVAKTPDKKDEFQNTIRQRQKEIQDAIHLYETSYMIPEEQKRVDGLKPALDDYYSYLEKAIKLGYDNDVNGYLEMAPDFKAAGDKVQENIRDLVNFNIDLSRKSAEDSNALYSSARFITIMVIAAAVLLSIGYGYALSQLISRPLKRVVDLVADVAQGDLTQTITIKSKDEVGVLAASINQMVVSLRQTVSHIVQSAESVASSAQQISASTQEVASTGTSQASDAQTVMELFHDIVKSADSQANDSQIMAELFKELSVAIDSVARNAEHTAELSENMLQLAQDSGEIVEGSIEGMNHVSRQMEVLVKDADKIGNIIGVINDIAGQTNLLALNAAIEAARAGEQGKGFAVVANEVRKLAEKSVEATKEITAIVQGIQNNTKLSAAAVHGGVQSSHKTGDAFKTMIEMVSGASSRVSEIAAASEEQSAQTTEVMKSIESIASASEQQSAQSAEVMKSVESIAAASEESAAATEQTSAASQALANLAEELNSSVSMFKLNSRD
ncbi:methyl-accepting chemotaxis protein [Peribacillus kribbensis]|uniref:methyl-accepting chemotaxis protein n=1 Tax=Peribacillus kribbensis TaxID=356658 RepID=UPI00041854C4|nr:methyl-accepting chemotaxis protein [Peribacillus kribbensis]